MQCDATSYLLGILNLHVLAHDDDGQQDELEWTAQVAYEQA